MERGGYSLPAPILYMKDNVCILFVRINNNSWQKTFEIALWGWSFHKKYKLVQLTEIVINPSDKQEFLEEYNNSKEMQKMTPCFEKSTRKNHMMLRGYP